MNKNIWEVIADLCIELHPDRVGTIADYIAGLSSACDFYKVKPVFGPVVNKIMINEFENAWMKELNVSPLEIAAALRSASTTAFILGKREVIEMVWTGPFTGLVSSRYTEQVLFEVIRFAKQSIFIVSFVAYDIDSVRTALQDAVRRNVRINILLESSRAHGGKIDFDSIDAFKKAIPTANIHTWHSKSRTADHNNGVVHAKCAVADGTLAFITSANLTRAAMESNMELGVLVRGGNLPVKLNRHLEALVTTKVIVKI